jgi:hypothetical protein
VKVQPHTFLISALDGRRWSASRPGRFTPRVRAPGDHWRGGWVCPRTDLDAVAKRKKSLPYPWQESNPGRPARSLVSILIELLLILLISVSNRCFKFWWNLTFILLDIQCISNLDLILSVFCRTNIKCRSQWPRSSRRVWGRSNTEVVGSNSTRHTDLCPHSSVQVLSCVGGGTRSANDT